MRKVIFAVVLMAAFFSGCMSDEEIRINGIKEEAKDIYIESKVKFDVAVAGGLESDFKIDSIESDLIKLIKSDPEAGLVKSKEIADTLGLIITNGNKIAK